MKKVISLAAAAAMTLSVLSVSSFVSAADSKVVDAFNIVMEDQEVVKGITSVKVPVAFDHDVSFTTANLKFSAKVTPNGAWVAAIKSIESALPAADVTAMTGEKYSSTVNLSSTSGKDYKIKKGEVVAYLNIELQDGKGNQAVNIPEGTIFKVSLDEADIANEKLVSYEISDEAKKDARSIIFVRPKNATEGFSVKIGSDITGADTVKVPIIVNGTLGVFRTEIGAGEGAKIKSLEVAEQYANELSITGEGKTLVYAHMSTEDMVFENATVAYANVEFTGDVSAADIKFRYFDSADLSDVALYPAEIENGTALHVLKGDIDLNGTANQLDATEILKEALALDFGDSTLPALYKENAEKDATLKNAIDKFGMDKVIEAGTGAGDVNSDKDITGDDATYLLRYLLEKDLDDDFQWSDLIK